MGTKLQELRNGCFAKAMDDEPMFVLLARDPGAPGLIRQWCDKRRAEISHGKRPATDIEQINEAEETARRMEAWRTENDGAWRHGLFALAEARGEAVAAGMAAEPSLQKGDEDKGRTWIGNDAPYGRHQDGRPKELGDCQ